MKEDRKIGNLKEKNVKEVSEILKKKGVVIFPTDTVYGIGTLPTRESVKRLYKIKKRDFSKKIIALISDVKFLFGLVGETEENMGKIEKVIHAYWPGELTIIFKADTRFTREFDEEMDTIGIRIPRNEMALEIIREAGGIVLTTSANISGEEPVRDLKGINSELMEQVDAIIGDTSELTGIPSTIVKYESGKMTLLREGNVRFKEIQKLMKG